MLSLLSPEGRFWMDEVEILGDVETSYDGRRGG